MTHCLSFDQHEKVLLLSRRSMGGVGRMDRVRPIVPVRQEVQVPTLSSSLGLGVWWRTNGDGAMLARESTDQPEPLQFWRCHAFFSGPKSISCVTLSVSPSLSDLDEFVDFFESTQPFLVLSNAMYIIKSCFVKGQGINWIWGSPCLFRCQRLRKVKSRFLS